MAYRMEIVSEEPTIITRQLGTEQFAQIRIEVGHKYVCDPVKPTTIKDRKNIGRIVEVLGFTDNWSPTGVIVKYLDNNRRGRLSPSDLIPYVYKDGLYVYSQDGGLVAIYHYSQTGTLATLSEVKRLWDFTNMEGIILHLNDGCYIVQKGKANKFKA